jgi:phosphosulfolactate phosphohydrolase-like enzyme
MKRTENRKTAVYMEYVHVQRIATVIFSGNGYIGIEDFVLTGYIVKKMVNVQKYKDQGILYCTFNNTRHPRRVAQRYCLSNLMKSVQ